MNTRFLVKLSFVYQHGSDWDVLFSRNRIFTPEKTMVHQYMSCSLIQFAHTHTTHHTPIANSYTHLLGLGVLDLCVWKCGSVDGGSVIWHRQASYITVYPPFTRVRYPCSKPDAGVLSRCRIDGSPGHLQQL